jgi:hypothetical protein
MFVLMADAPAHDSWISRGGHRNAATRPIGEQSFIGVVDFGSVQPPRSA